MESDSENENSRLQAFLSKHAQQARALSRKNIFGHPLAELYDSIFWPQGVQQLPQESHFENVSEESLEPDSPINPGGNYDEDEDDARSIIQCMYCDHEIKLSKVLRNMEEIKELHSKLACPTCTNEIGENTLRRLLSRPEHAIGYTREEIRERLAKIAAKEFVNLDDEDIEEPNMPIEGSTNNATRVQEMIVGSKGKNVATMNDHNIASSSRSNDLDAICSFIVKVIEEKITASEKRILAELKDHGKALAEMKEDVKALSSQVAALEIKSAPPSN